MLLHGTRTRSPASVAPAHALYLSGVFQSSAPSAAFRQRIARSPSFSLSRNADVTNTLSPATSTGASTCHAPLPFCQRTFGAGLGSAASLGGIAKSGSFFFSISYLSAISFHSFSTCASASAVVMSLPPSVTWFMSTQITPAFPPPTMTRPFAIEGDASMWTSSPGTSSRQTGRPSDDRRQWSELPSVWCIPSPNTTRPPLSTGEPTVGSRTEGAPLLHTGALPSPPASNTRSAPVLNAPITVKNTRLADALGGEMNCSFERWTQAILGAAGPALPSTFPVRAGPPRCPA